VTSEFKGIRRRRPGTLPKHELRRSGQSARSPHIPDLVHITAVGAAREIIEAGQIEARRCRIFGTDLVYFFVARPAYRLRDGDTKSDQISRFPFVFVISPNNLDAPYHVYPFDTGAGVAGVYGDRADPHVYLEDYALESNLAGAVAHMAWAFDSAEAYFDGDLRAGLHSTLQPWESVSKGFLTIAQLAATGHNQPDKRASAIEVAYRTHIPLRGNVGLVILPKQYLENGTATNAELLERLRQLEITWDTYDWQPNESPDYFLSEITRLVRRYLRSREQI
jgi:hypothetical protein